jgi:hypothetical protein
MDTAEMQAIEGGIHALVRAKRNGSTAVPCDDILAAGATSIADIDKLMEELRIARDYLEAEGERIRRLTSRYVHLTKTASASVRVISESLGKWRNPEMEAVTKADAQTARIEAQVPSLPPASSLPKNET